MCDNREELLEFLKSHNVIKRLVTYSSCGKPATFDNRQLKWRCQEKRKVKKEHKIQIISCSFSITIRKDMQFQNANISIEAACMFIGYFVTFSPPRQEFLKTELKMSSRNIVDWSNFIREAILSWCFKNSKQIGEPNCIVEIDEAKFGKRKYYRGHIIDRHGFSVDSREIRKIYSLFLSRTDQLKHAIKTNVLPGTTIISDCWKAYNCLDTEGFQQC